MRPIASGFASFLALLPTGISYSQTKWPVLFDVELYFGLFHTEAVEALLHFALY